jgi:hypothetical protein
MGVELVPLASEASSILLQSSATHPTTFFLLFVLFSKKVRKVRKVLEKYLDDFLMSVWLVLQYCKNHWKLKHLVTYTYSQWHNLASRTEADGSKAQMLCSSP